jgi:hypothetical protein
VDNINPTVQTVTQSLAQPAKQLIREHIPSKATESQGMLGSKQLKIGV